MCRIQQLLSEHTAEENHPLNCFAWGNLKSLKSENVDSLWDDLKCFYNCNYSADRLSIVIQAKTSDDLAELRAWVTESFGILENKNLGRQDFSLRVGASMPFDGNQHEMILMNTIADSNILHMAYQFQFDYERHMLKSLSHLTNLIGHEGPGSLF